MTEIRSAVYMTNSIGPNTETCGTPYMSAITVHSVFVTLGVLLSNVMLVRLTLANKGNLFAYFKSVFFSTCLINEAEV